ncbi:hypothetical protein QBC42DRAFT_214198 [Cladorrhinum samala]|uniref:DUF1993 domain-containing protein n=1 Tax=Cladorrhinum samala TaxID=585594 RepID=A0AAV9H898_9PEZI|nr:hypothetical protein QBC42DRAFT_214198 [Cladorrhinum samala]
MSLSLSALTLQTFSSGLSTLSHILKKAQEHSPQDVDSKFASARLIDDQLPLTFQVQVATNTVRKTLARLQGRETSQDGLPHWEDNETTFAQLLERLEAAKDLVSKADAAKIDERADVEVELPLGADNIFKLSCKDSVLKYSIPNFFFHINTAYSILRAKGVPVGKRDYLGSFFA